METPKVLLKSRRPPLPSNKLMDSLIAGKKLLNPHPLCTRSSSIRSLKTSSPKTLRSSSDTRKLILNSNLPQISSSSWCVVDYTSGRVLYGYRDLEVKEIASLSKIMTCYICLKLIEDRYCSFEDKVRISAKAAGMIGTSAGLKEGEVISVFDLLHGLMLPSGNDAAWALAEHFGQAISVNYSNTLKFSKVFIVEMNKYARSLGLYTTYYANPHGLIYKKNVSCARDVCKLSCVVMKDSNFRRVVNTKNFCAEVTDQSGATRKVCLENTNKLLGKGFDGIKTGVTDNAGPCLATGFRGNTNIIMTLLNSKSMEARWDEAQAISAWIANSY